MTNIIGLMTDGITEAGNYKNEENLNLPLKDSQKKDDQEREEIHYRKI